MGVALLMKVLGSYPFFSKPLLSAPLNRSLMEVHPTLLIFLDMLSSAAWVIKLDMDGIGPKCNFVCLVICHKVGFF